MSLKLWPLCFFKSKQLTQKQLLFGWDLTSQSKHVKSTCGQKYTIWLFRSKRGLPLSQRHKLAGQKNLRGLSKKLTCIHSQSSLSASTVPGHSTVLPFCLWSSHFWGFLRVHRIVDGRSGVAVLACRFNESIYYNTFAFTSKGCPHTEIIINMFLESASHVKGALRTALGTAKPHAQYFLILS